MKLKNVKKFKKKSRNRRSWER